MSNGSLEHVGVLGMKWGHHKMMSSISKRLSAHKQREMALREKMGNITKNADKSGNDLSGKDYERFKYRNRSLLMRGAGEASKAIAGVLINDFLTGKLGMHGYYLTPQDKIKRLKKIAINTTRSVITKDILAASAAKKYTNNGRLKPGTKKHIMTKEDLIESSVRLAYKVAPLAGWAISTKANKIRSDRAKNESTFKRWGPNILSEKVDHVIWQSDDQKTSVIDNRGR